MHVFTVRSSDFVSDTMSNSRVRALLLGAEELAHLIADLEDLQMRVERAEATALAGKQAVERKSGPILVPASDDWMTAPLPNAHTYKA